MATLEHTTFWNMTPCRLCGLLMDYTVLHSRRYYSFFVNYYQLSYLAFMIISPCHLTLCKLLNCNDALKREVYCL